MGFFDKHEPVILKESSSAKAQLEALESLRGTLPANAEKQLEKEIRTLEAGIKGEQLYGCSPFPRCGYIINID